MKRILIGDGREDLLSTLETITRHWGYRTLASSGRRQLLDLLRETSPDLLVFGATLFTDQQLTQQVTALCEAGCPLILLQEEGCSLPALPPHQTLAVPVDLFSFFELTQKHLEKYPRKNLRLFSKLPGLICAGESSAFSQILSLSAEGLFIKTGARLDGGESLRVIFPLVGMQRELEVGAQVLYRVHPGPENNYLQGVGIQFVDLEDGARRELEEFLENSFLDEITSSNGEEPPHHQQLQRRTDNITLRLSRST
jgi:Tfp pilus assembly protein PilZ